MSGWVDRATASTPATSAGWAAGPPALIELYEANARMSRQKTEDLTEAEINAAHAKRWREIRCADRIIATKTIEKGLLIVHTGTGKGKTTAAFGLAMRCLGHGMKVGIVQFVKGRGETGERAALERFPDQVEVKVMGEGFTWETQDRARDIAAARAAWDKAKALLADDELHLVDARRAQHRAALRLSAARRGGRGPAGQRRRCTSSSPAATPSRS